MMNRILTVALSMMWAWVPSQACTSMLVSKGASHDSSVMITYLCDGEFHPHLRVTPAADYPEGAILEIKDWYGKVLGEIEQVPHTYAVFSLMNEHQLAIGETTFDGRLELQNPEGLLHYWWLMQLALQRCKTAREAIHTIADLVDRYGYRSTGESFSIADKEEAWILEMIGKGPGKKGAVWVAVKVPDGFVSAHANKARIGAFPLDDPDRCLYAPDVIDLAVDAGYYDPDSGKPFSFCDAYCPATPKNRRYADTRVWSIFSRLAPSQNLSPDTHRSVPGAEPYPLFIKPDEKVTVAQVFSLMRDHYEGTPFDMRTGLDSGPFNTPNRWRPIFFEVDGQAYSWERPISTQQTGFSFVSQSRSWLPDPIGGVFWYGVDDTYTSCYTPFYCGVDRVPETYATGELSRFSWDSAWWVFNFVANFANLRYRDMVEEILAVQRDVESQYLSLQPAVEQTALSLAETQPEVMQRYLTDYCLTHADALVRRWRDLAETLMTKFNDGYVQESPGRPAERGYPKAWLQRVLRDRPEAFLLPEKDADVPETRLID